MQHWLRTNQGVGAILLALMGLLTLFIWFSPWAHREMRDGFTLGFFPLLGAVAMLVCAAIMVVDNQRKEVPDDFQFGHLSDIPLTIAMLAATYVYFQVSHAIGFLLASPPFLLAFMLILGLRPWTIAAGVSVGMTIVIYIVFSLLGITLPQGPMPF